MDTKDRAIAPTNLQNAYTAIERMIQGYYHTKNPFHSPVTADAQWALREIKDRINARPAPDCRTCLHLYPDLDAIKRCGTVCTNGDQYQPAPAVVLWRTE